MLLRLINKLSTNMTLPQIYSGILGVLVAYIFRNLIFIEQVSIVLTLLDSIVYTFNDVREILTGFIFVTARGLLYPLFENRFKLPEFFCFSPKILGEFKPWTLKKFYFIIKDLLKGNTSHMMNIPNSNGGGSSSGAGSSSGVPSRGRYYDPVKDRMITTPVPVANPVANPTTHELPIQTSFQLKWGPTYIELKRLLDNRFNKGIPRNDVTLNDLGISADYNNIYTKSKISPISRNIALYRKDYIMALTNGTVGKNKIVDILAHMEKEGI